jgi:hypothetical protein
MAFLFIWQFILSGPLEIASGYIGFAKYASYIWQGLSPRQMMLLAAGIGVLNIILLYRPIAAIGKITVSLWIGTVLTTAAVILTGMWRFDSRIAFDFPPDAFDFSLGFLLGLGGAARIGIYDYLGYYDVCYIGEEVKEAGAGDPALDPDQRRGRRFHLLRHQPLDHRRHSLARVRSGRRPAALEFHRLGFHGESLRLFGGHRVHGDDPVDGIWIGLRAASGLLAHSLCGSSGRVLLQGLRPAPSDEEFSSRVAARQGGDGHHLQFLFAGNRH